ncbi:hypothetical protein DY000_02005435 [Brassica cretica]|uniref:Uncharacterized protein n=1 Tax=Brassica cretica TaxID=69181 RepID=A0ABQ7CGX5_BRACR|nr:hypothetical protein DY000_02005435 [Brassica cretica]
MIGDSDSSSKDGDRDPSPSGGMGSEGNPCMEAGTNLREEGEIVNEDDDVLSDVAEKILEDLVAVGDQGKVDEVVDEDDDIQDGLEAKVHQTAQDTVDITRETKVSLQR